MELVDKVLIGRKLTQLDTYLDQIKEFSNISVMFLSPGIFVSRR
jgi:hypothetical protein